MKSEVDILEDGSLALEDDILAAMDVVAKRCHLQRRPSHLDRPCGYWPIQWID